MDSITPSSPATGDMILRQADNIVLKILTHLDFPDLVRTSVLSRPWRYLWITSSPNLIFDYEFLTPQCLNINQSVAEAEAHLIFAEADARLLFAEQTLGIRSRSSCCCLDKLVLDHVKISSQRGVTSLDNCIRYAVACDLKHLELSVNPRLDLGTIRSPDAPLYLLLPTLFGHRGLVELCLSCCRLESSSFPTNMTLSSLKRLRLGYTMVDSMNLVQDLIASCPLIQDLTLFYVFAFKPVMKFNVANRVLKINGVVNNPKLINVDIKQCTFERIEIDAPGLQSFTFGHAMNRAPCNEVSAPPCDIVVSGCKDIRKLELYDIDNVSAFANCSLSRFLHLESVSLCDCRMETIKISSSRLKKLLIFWCEELVKVEIDDPNLSSFCYVGSKMIHFSSNALNLSVNINLSCPDNVDTIWFIELVDFLGRFNTAKALTLDIASHKNVIVPQELRTFLLPPLSNVEHLVLKIEEESFTQTIDEIIDGVLWLSPRPVSVSFTSKGKILELTFLYDEIDGEGNYCNCFSSLIICWRHCLKEVEIKNLGMADADDEVEKKINSFFEHALTLRKFEDVQV